MDSLRFCVIWPPYQAIGPEGVTESWGSEPLTSDLCGPLEEYELRREAEGNLNWWWAGILGLEHLCGGSPGQERRKQKYTQYQWLHNPWEKQLAALVSDSDLVPAVGSFWCEYIVLWLPTSLYLRQRQVKWITVSYTQQSLGQNTHVQRRLTGLPCIQGFSLIISK